MLLDVIVNAGKFCGFAWRRLDGCGLRLRDNFTRDFFFCRGSRGIFSAWLGFFCILDRDRFFLNLGFNSRLRSLNLFDLRDLNRLIDGKRDFIQEFARELIERREMQCLCEGKPRLRVFIQSGVAFPEDNLPCRVG